MSFEQRFTEQEQLLLSSAPVMIGSSMAFAESSGLATVKELMASAKTYMDGLKAYPNNEIIQGVLPNLEDHKEAIADAKKFREKTTARIKEKGIDSQEKMRALLLADTSAINTLLIEKATVEEAAEYKEWIMLVATNVAKAAKEGGFLGFGGERISAAEKVLFAELAQVLGMSSVLA
ncbi:MAG: hypothetical protein GQ582_11785 [Methyloprofundus sp.]|nr:hypothetical protein [Methyloprofundus sp.]